MYILLFTIMVKAFESCQCNGKFFYQSVYNKVKGFFGAYSPALNSTQHACLFRENGKLNQRSVA